MKKTIMLIAAFALVIGAKAQSLEEGIKMYHYERYGTAKSMLEPMAGSNAEANYYVGLSQIGLGELEAAKATFNKYLEDPANISGLARVAFEQKNVVEGNKIAENVAGMAKRKNWEPLRYAADAITYTDGGNIQQAIAWYEKALESDADNAWLHIGLGDAYRKMQGGGGKAMTNYEKVVEKDAKNSLAYSRIGRLWYAATTYKLALENFEKAKEADPSNPIPYRELANAWQRSGNYQKAKENIQKYRELSDKSPEVERQYLDLLFLTKDYTNAISGARVLLKSGMQKPGIHGILGASLYETGDSTTTKEAASEYGTYIHTTSKDKVTPSDYVYYGKILLKDKQVDSANHYFNVGLSKDTAADKSETYRAIAEGFKTAREYPTSANWYSKLVHSSDKGTATDYFYYGYLNFVTGNLDTAAKAFEEMEMKHPDQPTAPYYRGRVAAAIDSNAKTGAAVPHYEKWLATPDNDQYTKKSTDLMNVYQYMAFYYYNKGDKANMKKYLDEIEKLEPNNSFLKQLREEEKKMK